MALAQAKSQSCALDLEKAIYFGGRNAVHTVDRFSLAPEQVVEVDRQIEI
jgi:hypothetical protein